MTSRKAWAAIAVVMSQAHVAGHAAVSAEEAAKLKGALTPVGAERAGNKDGSIPEWKGGYAASGPAYASGARPDPFAGEKPLFSVTAANLEQYADKLSEGQKALLKKYPSYRMDIYPTHRTASAPQWVYDNTFKNATRAKTTQGGFGVEGAYGGIPFPIPKTGNEIMWNHLLSWQGESIYFPYNGYTVTAGGKPVLATKADVWGQWPYYYKEGAVEAFKGEYWFVFQTVTAPAFKVGEMITLRDPVEMQGQGRQAWQYLPGQRRVRKSPTVAYDTPDFIASGIGNFDEAYVFNGPQDRHEWKLIGKKEVFVPYNNNRFAAAKISDAMGPQYLNPDLVRWELHRVWVVEAVLAPGKRHAVPKKRFYFDEDTWYSLIGEGYDAQGQIWKNYFSLTLLAPEIPALVTFMNWGQYDLLTGAYLLNLSPNEMPVQWKPEARKPDSFFSPDGLVAKGVR